MISIREDLIRLGFCRTMYAENKRNTIEGIYDGVYNGVVLSLEISTNGYIARAENLAEDHRYSNNRAGGSQTPPLQEAAQLPFINSGRRPFASPNSEGTGLSRLARNRSIRSEVLTMHDILHALKTLTADLQLKERSTSQ